MLKCNLRLLALSWRLLTCLKIFNAKQVTVLSTVCKHYLRHEGYWTNKTSWLRLKKIWRHRCTNAVIDKHFEIFMPYKMFTFYFIEKFNKRAKTSISVRTFLGFDPYPNNLHKAEVWKTEPVEMTDYWIVFQSLLTWIFRSNPKVWIWVVH